MAAVPRTGQENALGSGAPAVGEGGAFFYNQRMSTRFHRGRFTLAVSSAAAIAILPFFMAAQGRGQSTAAAPDQAGGTRKVVAAPKAIEYYDAACRRCHGPEGSFYGPELGKGKTDAELVKVIDDMAKGPGNEPLDPAGLAAQTAYHRAIIAGAPYVSVTGVNEGTISGEVMTDSKVTVTADGKDVAATVSDSTWTAKVAPDAKMIAVTAERNGKKTTLAVGGAVGYSHAAPIAATQPAAK